MAKTTLKKGSCGKLRNGSCACRAKNGRMKFVKCGTRGTKK